MRGTIPAVILFSNAGRVGCVNVEPQLYPDSHTASQPPSQLNTGLILHERRTDSAKGGAPPSVPARTNACKPGAAVTDARAACMCASPHAGRRGARRLRHPASGRERAATHAAGLAAAVRAAQRVPPRACVQARREGTEGTFTGA
eukprot:364039-Chlamydomonas_euryale.AAC.1